MTQDEWDARFKPYKKPRISEGRRQGLFLILLAMGIPLMAFFFQDDGELKVYGEHKIFERNVTPPERDAIKLEIEKYKAGLDRIQRIVEDVKEQYRAEIGEGYYQERWVVHSKDGLAIPFKYFLGLGALLLLIGLGKLIL